jgi:methylase of polypeptide subunit release factors
MSAASEYAELLKLIEVSGPFLSLPVFKETFPQGLVKDSPALTREMKELYEEWRVARSSSQGFVSPAQREWLGAVFETLFGWPAEWIAQDNAIPQNVAHTVAQHRETLRPDAVLLDAGKPRLLISILAPNQQPDRRPAATTWNATCAARMAELLHATRIPVGLVTNGERFTLVYAEPGQPTGFADFRAEFWFDERLTLRAFRDFLSADALFNRPPEQAIEGLYLRSLENQQEVSITLGRQVRRAVEMFVSALDRADRESDRALLAGVPEEHVYEAALFLMMRLVFLFFAEERDLLPMTNPVYQDNYAVSTLHDQLREAADRLGEEVLERRYDAFPRLLATFRAVHGGIEHDLAALPAYGGDLFDPDRFPFLEGRTAGSDWHKAAAQPCPIHNRTVLHLLRALQFLEIKVPGGWEKRRLSFRALDIEQIGHVYEGLLDHTVRRAQEIVLSLEGKEAPDVTLSELQRRSQQPAFIDWLAGETGRTAKAIEKCLKNTSINDPLRWPDWEQVSRFAALVRRDDNGDPGIIPAGSLYVTAGTARRQTGTQYTPRTLTESVVEHALAPQVYVGPVEGVTPEKWLLKSAGQILSLKICDLACGSGAFLVAAARYVSDRLSEAWDAAQCELGKCVQITPHGCASSGLPEEELIPSEPDERSLYALRIVVERCIYGVDRNPLAVEMAKLSLWLLTLQRNRPFTFLDHAIRCGDSLLGVTRRSQIESFGFSTKEHEVKQITFWRNASKVLFERALECRLKLESFPALAITDLERKQELLQQAEEATAMTRLMCDLLVGAALATATGKPPQGDDAFERKRADLWRQLMETYRYDEDVDSWRDALEAMRPTAQQSLKVGLPPTSSPHRTFHWPLEFPEVFVNRDGFDAIVGNPPFMGGQKITGALGTQYRDYLVSFVAEGARGSADVSAYFLLRAISLLSTTGKVGLITTSTIAQGDTREVGLDRLVLAGIRITRAVSSRTWPGDATVFYSALWLCRHWSGDYILDDRPVSEITSALRPASSVAGKPFRVAANDSLSFIGSYALGMGFVLEPDDAKRLIDKDQRNRHVLFPYLIGQDLNSSPDQSPTRWVINFHNWPEERAREYADCFEIVERLVKPQRLAQNDKYGRDHWWQFLRTRPELYRSIAGMQRILVVSLITNHVSFAFVPSTWVFAHKLAVFPLNSDGHLALLQSSLHYVWAWEHSSTNLSLLNYSPSDCFTTFPFPGSVESLEEIGLRYEAHRRGLMAARSEGLTVTYNRFHSAHEVSHDIVTLRRWHAEMDYAVASTYGWSSLDLGHDFHETKQGMRYTISQTARSQVLDRLLALNHERYAAEQVAAKSEPKPNQKARKASTSQPALF